MFEITSYLFPFWSSSDWERSHIIWAKRCTFAEPQVSNFPSGHGCHCLHLPRAELGYPWLPRGDVQGDLHDLHLHGQPECTQWQTSPSPNRNLWEKLPPPWASFEKSYKPEILSVNCHKFKTCPAHPFREWFDSRFRLTSWHHSSCSRAVSD